MNAYFVIGDARVLCLLSLFSKDVYIVVEADNLSKAIPYYLIAIPGNEVDDPVVEFYVEKLLIGIVEDFSTDMIAGSKFSRSVIEI